MMIGQVSEPDHVSEYHANEPWTDCVFLVVEMLGL